MLGGLVKKDSNIRMAYVDLFSGKAHRYDSQFTDRYKQIAECQTNICEVNVLSDVPATIYFDDITSNAEDWRNKEYAKYFGKEAIVLKTSEGGQDL